MQIQIQLNISNVLCSSSTSVSCVKEIWFMPQRLHIPDHPFPFLAHCFTMDDVIRWTGSRKKIFGFNLYSSQSRNMWHRVEIRHCFIVRQATRVENCWSKTLYFVVKWIVSALIRSGMITYCKERVVSRGEYIFLSGVCLTWPCRYNIRRYRLTLSESNK